MPASQSKLDLEQALKAQFKDVTKGQSAMNFGQFMAVTNCRSRLFAHRLFDAIDVDHSGDISFEELVNAIYVLQTHDSEARIKYIFDLFDLDHDGTISREELQAVLAASVEEGDVSMPKEETEELANTLMDLFEMDEDDAICYDEFHRVMRTFPDMLKGLSLEGVSTFRVNGERSDKRRTGRVEAIKSWIINNPQKTFTYVLLTLVLSGTFFWRFQRYIWDCDGVGYAVESKADALDDPIKCRDARKRRLMSWSLPIAKGCGQAMKATFTLILFPVSRNFMTHLRSTFLQHFFCFDGAIEFHRLLGKIGFVLAWIHTLCHICDVVRWTDKKRYEEWFHAFPDDDGKDEASQPTPSEILSTSFGVTGIMLISIYTIAALFALDYPKRCNIFREKLEERNRRKPLIRRIVLGVGRLLNNFNCFWYTHQLFAVFYICMLLHPYPHIPDERNEWGWSDSWVWVFIPVTLYATERFARAMRSETRDTSVLAADVLPGKVVGLKLMKPRGLVYTAGQYVFINCPQLSRFEWHPFTLTSSPGDSFLSVHMRAGGDWTTALYDMIRDFYRKSEGIEIPSSPPSGVFDRPSSVILKSVSGSIEEVTPSFPFKILVDGPFGAPAQNFKDYRTLVLVGAGIGVTPFASVLNELLDTMQNHRCARCGLVNLPSTVRTRKVYFYWTVRSRNEAAWFKHMLEAISMQDHHEFIDINIHITSIRRANDVRVMLLRLAQHYNREKQGVDPLAGLRTRAITHFGRPNWAEVFTRVKMEHPDEKYFGVFFCGPNGLAHVLKKECDKHSNKSQKFEFRKEIF